VLEPEGFQSVGISDAFGLFGRFWHPNDKSKSIKSPLLRFRFINELNNLNNILNTISQLIQ
ncbi:MAG: hypothetical protein ACREGC_03570, partial [Minisyncoccia bacterium]